MQENDGQDIGRSRPTWAPDGPCVLCSLVRIALLASSLAGFDSVSVDHVILGSFASVYQHSSDGLGSYVAAISGKSYVSSLTRLHLAAAEFGGTAL